MAYITIDDFYEKADSCTVLIRNQEKECFELDESRTELGNVITPLSAQKAMGYGQMDYWVPIKVK